MKENRYPMHTEQQARYQLLLARRDYQEGRLKVGPYKEVKARIYKRWPRLKPEAWQDGQGTAPVSRGD